MHSAWMGEFLGTMILILLGDGVVAGVLLKRSKVEGSGWMVITAGWAFAVMAGVFTAIACGSGGAHLNPAVTLGFAVRAGDFQSFLPYLTAQVVGALVGATLVWLHYLLLLVPAAIYCLRPSATNHLQRSAALLRAVATWMHYFPHWKETSDAGAKLACFCPAPAIRNTIANFSSEVIATFVLVFVVGAIFSKTVSANGPANALGPYLVGSLVWGIGLSLGGTTGYAINPARDFGPRLAHAILPIEGKGGSDWSYAPIPILGPLAGGALAGFALRLLQI